MPNPITRENVIEKLAAAVATRGEDYKYFSDHDNAVSCVYRDPDGSPSCLIAVLLDREGYDISELNNSVRIALILANYYPLPEIELIDKAVHAALVAAQEAQDRGYTWGESLADAKTVLEFKRNEYSNE